MSRVSFLRAAAQKLVDDYNQGKPAEECITVERYLQDGLEAVNEAARKADIEFFGL